MTKRGLTSNEKRVLHGLVRHPILNDRELSEVLGVKVSTVTAIRRRLRRAEYFTARRVPMMNRLGWEILAAGHASFDLAQGSQTVSRLREVLKDRFPNLFHVVSSPDHFVFVAGARNYTEFRRDLDELRAGLNRARLLGENDVQSILFPVSLSVVPAFFDYARPLALDFGIEDKSGPRPELGKQDDVDLSKKEAEVLKGLVRFPELSDKALAQKVKVSRQAVSKMRHGFEEDGVLRTVRLPNLRLLGFELHVAAFARLTASSPLRARIDSIEHLLRTTPTFLLASSDAESFLLGAARNYEQFSTLRHSLIKYIEERGYLRQEPTVLLGLSATTEIVRNCEFAHPIESLTSRGARSPG